MFNFNIICNHTKSLIDKKSVIYWKWYSETLLSNCMQKKLHDETVDDLTLSWLYLQVDMVSKNDQQKESYILQT